MKTLKLTVSVSHLLLEFAHVNEILDDRIRQILQSGEIHFKWL